VYALVEDEANEVEVFFHGGCLARIAGVFEEASVSALAGLRFLLWFR
jgi:hypothetical protein